LSGSVTITDLANATLTASIAADSVALGTDTTGNYVASVSGTDGVSISGTGEGASVTIANSDKGSSQNIFKNIAVMGGLLVLASAGAGSFSIDGRKEAK
jgi:putative oxidoreductase